MEFITNAQEKALNARATLYADATAKCKAKICDANKS